MIVKICKSICHLNSKICCISPITMTYALQCNIQGLTKRNPFIGKPRRSQSIQKGPKGLSPDSGECRAEWVERVETGHQQGCHDRVADQAGIHDYCLQTAVCSPLTFFWRIMLCKEYIICCAYILNTNLVEDTLEDTHGFRDRHTIQYLYLHALWLIAAGL